MKQDNCVSCFEQEKTFEKQVCEFACWKANFFFYQPNVLIMISTWIYVHVECILHAMHLSTPAQTYIYTNAQCSLFAEYE